MTKHIDKYIRSASWYNWIYAKSITIITVVYNNYSDLDQYISSFWQTETNFKYISLTSPQNLKNTARPVICFSSLCRREQRLCSWITGRFTQKHLRWLWTLCFMNNDTTVDHTFCKECLSITCWKSCSDWWQNILFFRLWNYHKIDIHRKIWDMSCGTLVE